MRNESHGSACSIRDGGSLEEGPEIPDNRLARGDGARADEADDILESDEGKAMAMTEMGQWYVKKGSVTGERNARALLYDSIIDAICDADVAG